MLALCCGVYSVYFPLVLRFLVAGEGSASSATPLATTALCSTFPNPDSKQVGIKLGTLFETLCSCVLLTREYD